jgi:hypothetical protein
VPELVVPVVNLIEPEVPSEPASTERKINEPLDVAVPAPVLMLIDPPVFGVLVPAEAMISPPAVALPVPIDNTKSPAFPPVAAPVEIATAPDAPALVVPVEKVRPPLMPVDPALNVCTSILPLDFVDPRPVVRLIEPPVFSSSCPALMRM